MMKQTDSAVPALHDFDFLVGQWQAHHRKLKQRLANNREWIEFKGTLSNQPLMGSYSNVDDTVLGVPDAPYRGVALRSLERKPSSGQSGGSILCTIDAIRVRRWRAFSSA